MIEGIKTTVQGPELVHLLLAQRTFHNQRAEEYRTQIKAMTDAKIVGMDYSNGDPVKNLQDRLEIHERNAGELEFIANHIDLKETYLLDSQDLVRIGVLKNRYL